MPAGATVSGMNNDLVLQPVTSGIAVRCRRAASAASLVAWKLVLAAAPSINLYWTVGTPPYRSR